MRARRCVRACDDSTFERRTRSSTLSASATSCLCVWSADSPLVSRQIRGGDRGVGEQLQMTLLLSTQTHIHTQATRQTHHRRACIVALSGAVAARVPPRALHRLLLHRLLERRRLSHSPRARPAHGLGVLRHALHLCACSTGPRLAGMPGRSMSGCGCTRRCRSCTTPLQSRQTPRTPPARCCQRPVQHTTESSGGQARVLRGFLDGLGRSLACSP